MMYSIERYLQPLPIVSGILIGIFLMVTPAPREAMAQSRYYYNWYFGDSLGLNFETIVPRVQKGLLSTFEGSDAISDPNTGKLLFYTDGSTVWNRYHEVMPGGTGLKGGNSSTQSALIVPIPEDPTRFYVFTADTGPYDGFDLPHEGINYRVVDMKLDGGLGGVTGEDVNLLPVASEKLVGVRHCNGRDFWVIGFQDETSVYNAWLVSADGIADPVITHIPASLDPRESAIGYLKASPDGKYLFIVESTARNIGRLLEFDHVSGRIVRSIARIPATYGASFSPNSRHLFVDQTDAITGASEIVRYYLASDDSTDIVRSRRIIGRLDRKDVQKAGSMQLGPDSNLYIALPGFRIGVVRDPDGTNPLFVNPLYEFPRTSFSVTPVMLGLANCIDGLVIGAGDQLSQFSNSDTTICEGDSLQLAGGPGERYRWDQDPDIDCPICQTTLVTPSRSTTYSLSIWNSEGCEFRQTFRVKVLPVARTEISGERSICIGEEVQLRASGGELFRWDSAIGLSCLDCPDPVTTPTRTTTYYVTTWDTTGCPGRDSITISVHQPPVADAGPDVTLCAGESAQLTGMGDGSIYWSNIDGSQATTLSCNDCSDPIASPDTTTAYILQIRSPEGCLAYDTVTIRVAPAPVLTADGDTSYCGTGVAQLSITGGTRYLWEDAPDLSCLECSSPRATPRQTTTYYVTGYSAEGCEARDSVTVIIEPSGIIPLRIGRAYRGSNGDPITIAIESVEDGFWSDITDISIELQYDAQVMLIDTGSFADLLKGTLLEGWDLEVLSYHGGVVALALSDPANQGLSGSGDLLRFRARMFLSENLGTELPFSVRTTNECFSFSVEPGYAAVDTICGLSLRLIELSGGKYRPPSVYPNPATSDRVTFDFGIGLEGRTRLEVYDQRGNRVAILIDQVLVPGTYRVEWMTGDVASGIYNYRLTSGTWNQAGTVGVE